MSIDGLSCRYSIWSILTLWSLSRSKVTSAQMEPWTNTITRVWYFLLSKKLQFSKKNQVQLKQHPKTGLRYVWKRQLTTQTRSSTGLKNWAQLRIEICGFVFSTLDNERRLYHYFSWRSSCLVEEIFCSVFPLKVTIEGALWLSVALVWIFLVFHIFPTNKKKKKKIEKELIAHPCASFFQVLKLTVPIVWRSIK